MSRKIWCCLFGLGPITISIDEVSQRIERYGDGTDFERNCQNQVGCKKLFASCLFEIVHSENHHGHDGMAASIFFVAPRKYELMPNDKPRIEKDDRPEFQ